MVHRRRRRRPSGRGGDRTAADAVTAGPRGAVHRGAVGGQSAHLANPIGARRGPRANGATRAGAKTDPRSAKSEWKSPVTAIRFDLPGGFDDDRGGHLSLVTDSVCRELTVSVVN